MSCAAWSMRNVNVPGGQADRIQDRHQVGDIITDGRIIGFKSKEKAMKGATRDGSLFTNLHPVGARCLAHKDRS